MKYLMLIVLTQLTNLYSVAQTDAYRYSYRFTDSSVPPDYHRSYEIIIENGFAQFSVDSYGDVLFNETIMLKTDQLNVFVNGLKACKLSNKTESKDNGCTGGTTDSFSIQSSTMSPVDGFSYSCGGKLYGNLKGKMEDAKNLFTSMIPDFGRKLEGTRK